MARLVDNVNDSSSAACEEIAEEIHRVRHLFNARRYAAESEHAHDMARMEARALTHIARHPGATHGDLVVHLSRDKGQVARLVGALKARGFVVTRADGADRRIQRLDLTDAGRDAQANIQRERQKVARQAFSELDDAERETLLAMLRKVRRKLEEF